MSAAHRHRLRRPGVSADHRHYKWWALSCTSLGMLLATINSGTLIIALPDLERSLHTTLLAAGLGDPRLHDRVDRAGADARGACRDLFGRKSAYVGGFAVFALASLGAGFAADGTELILWRILQGIGAAFLFANAAALVTDAFPQGAAGPGDGHQHDGRRRSGWCSARCWAARWSRSPGTGCSGSTSRSRSPAPPGAR